MLVEVRPLPMTKWHGKKDKESFTQPKIIEVLYNSTTGEYDTGLTDEEANKYGKLLGVDLGKQFNPNEEHPFWSSKASWVKLENFTQVFNTDKAIEFVKVKNMKASKFVANSMRAYEDGHYPNATHVIYDEEEEVDLKASKVQMKERCYLIASKMSADDKIAMVQILSSKSAKGRSNNFIDVEIGAIIEDKAADFEKYAKMGKEEIGVRASVLEMIARNILTKEGSAVYYMSELIGQDYEGAVKWFKDPQNSRMKVAVLEKLNKQ